VKEPNPILIGVQDEILRLAQLGLLAPLLKDQTTGHNIRWATDAYAELGRSYEKNAEITPDLITGEHSGVIRNRARKELELQSDRTKSHAEVFSPIWVCNRMIDAALEESRNDVRDAGECDAWIQSRWLEITCGEAPFLVQRYDVLTGEVIPIEQRKGILDRKLQSICPLKAYKDVGDFEGVQWIKSMIRAFQSVYGYELQGDNLLIARLNLYMTFEEYLDNICHRKPSPKESKQIINIITSNLWQMDGLTGHTPCDEEPPSPQRSLFDWAGVCQKPKETPKPCQIRFYINSRNIKTFTIPQLAEQGEQTMKFDYIVGNPPYQEEAPGTSTSDIPIYHLFMDETYKLSNKVVLVTPGRFLFNAGATPSAWNERMLNDKHLKVIWYEQDSSKLFPNTDIKGGVAVTYHNNCTWFDEIGVFTSFTELNSIYHKVSKLTVDSLNMIIYTQNKFQLDVLNNDIPNLNRSDKRLESNIFKLEIFKEQRKSNSDLKILGLTDGNKRTYRYVDNKYIDTSHPNLDKYKVILPKSNGSGAIGEVLSTPLIGEPLIGYTRTFIGIGAFDDNSTAENCLKYIKSKFCRTMLGVLKITQDNNPEKWKYVPLQDFTENSDIDWSKSIPEIDQQLYKKYGLDENEIEFIETHVKAMT
jgi:type II restriction enzyme